MKRLAYILIGTGCLTIISVGCLAENPFAHQELPDYDAPPEEPEIITLIISGLAWFIFFPLPGWLLSGTSVPREGIGHRLIMTFAACLAGMMVAGGLMIGTFALREFLFPSPPLPDINDR